MRAPALLPAPPPLGPGGGRRAARRDRQGGRRESRGGGRPLSRPPSRLGAGRGRFLPWKCPSRPPGRSCGAEGAGGELPPSLRRRAHTQAQGRPSSPAPRISCSPGSAEGRRAAERPRRAAPAWPRRAPSSPASSSVRAGARRRGGGRAGGGRAARGRLAGAAGRPGCGPPGVPTGGAGVLRAATRVGDLSRGEPRWHRIPEPRRSSLQRYGGFTFLV